MFDLVECLIFIGLAVMLGYTVLVTARFFRRYYIVCRESQIFVPDSASGAEQNKKNLVAELSRGVATLKSIAAAAPFLGLAGMSYGILAIFSRTFLGFRLVSISQELSTALIATAAGLIVAMPAAISYNILRTSLDKFESKRSSMLFKATPRSYGFAQTLPLQRRFSGFPAFALIAAPVLGILVPMLALILRPQTSVGLPVYLSKIGVSNHDSGQIVVSVVGSSTLGQFDVYVNSEKTPWNELSNTLRSQLSVRTRWIVQVATGTEVPWADVVNAMDVARGLHAEVVLLTSAPNVSSNLRNARFKRKPRMK